jgi:hypothetical protein
MAIEPGLSGPHLSAAFLCEKVLHERDGVASFIRVVDRFTVAVPPKLPENVILPPGMFPPPIVQFFLAVSIKSGTLTTGQYQMTIKLSKDGAIKLPDNELKVFLNGSDDNGVLVILPVNLPNPEEGLYWFDIYFETGLITRVPLRILYQQMQFPQMPFPQKG